MLCYLLTHVMTTFDSVYEKDAVQEKPVVFTTRISPTMISPVPLLYSETVSDMKQPKKKLFYTYKTLFFFNELFFTCFSEEMKLDEERLKNFQVARTFARDKRINHIGRKNPMPR